ncbi:AAA domain-containing protein [bacterium]|nr:AAA domain-containing protein [bacterium]
MAQIKEVEGIPLVLSHPDSIRMEWIGSEEVREQLEAAWLIVQEGDTPLNPRLVGKPGVGKTTLAYAVARSIGKDVYIMQCTMDTRPEDLIVTPVIAGEGRIAYHASPLVTAMLTGAVCILDEGNRMSEKSWASLAPLLDARRYVESIIAGIKIAAHPEFRVCVTMNDDASTYEIPEYIQSRLQPQIEVSFPSRDEEIAILQFNVPWSEAQAVQYVADFLQKAHGVNLAFTSRDGVNILRFAHKLAKLKGGEPKDHLRAAIEAVLGADGAEFLDSGLPAQRMTGLVQDVEDLEELLGDDDDDAEDDEDFLADDSDDDEDRR